MEQNTKNFDRKIEQMMNEHQVAPPFGAWNRISAELDAMPVAVAVAATAAPVATALIPKRVLTGIIAAALVIGSSVITGYLVNSHNNNTAHLSNIATKTTVASTTTTKPVVQQTEPVKNTVIPSEIALTKVRVKHIVATNPVQSTIVAAQQVQPVINQPVVLTPVINNDNTDVPTPLEPVSSKAEDTQTYFFPPIDVTTPEKTATPNKTAVSNKSHTGDGTTTTASSDDDKPARKRFHPGRRHNFSYGNINRQ